MKAISNRWEGTLSERQAWASLKTELHTAQLEEERLAAVAKRKQGKAELSLTYWDHLNAGHDPRDMVS